jgi:hypothetical protein
MIEIYKAGNQARKVRFAMLLSLACALGGSWWGLALLRTPAATPAEDGTLWGPVVAGLGIAFAVGMWLYGRLYVRDISFDPGLQMLHIRTLGMFGAQRLDFPPSDVVRSTYFDGRLDNPVGVSVDAPWFNIWVRGQRWPLILDAQGVFPDPQLSRRLLKG